MKVLDVRAGNKTDQELGHVIHIGLNNLEAEFREGIIADCEHIAETYLDLVVQPEFFKVRGAESWRKRRVGGMRGENSSTGG